MVSASPAAGVTSPRRRLRALVTGPLRVVLEQRSVRFAVIGMMLVASSLLAMVPTSSGVDYGWMFIVPVAISAIAAGLGEGAAVALAASLLCALYAGVVEGFSLSVFIGVFTGRFALYGITAAVLGSFAEAHQSVQSSLRVLAGTDPLTRVANVASFYEHIGELESKHADYTVLIVDVDDLKGLNDRYGHQTGTAAIQLVAGCLRQAVRASDQVARYGGDEFVVLLHEADRAGAQIVVNRLRQMLGAETLAGAAGRPVTVSVGTALSGYDGSTADEMLAAADAAMYRDKRARNQSGQFRGLS